MKFCPPLTTHRNTYEMDTKNQSSPGQGDEEDYIDMEVMSPSSSLCSLTEKLPPQSREEFEFQMFSSSRDDRDNSPSPADELFYKGKLLPLHLPRRLQMVRNILENSAPLTITSSTPLDSCSVSPSESCRVSCELNPDEYFFHWSTEMLSTVQQPKNYKCWSKKLRFIKHTSISQKLRASTLYFKSLFTKSEETGNGSKIKDFLNNNSNYIKLGNKNNPFEETIDTTSTTTHRRSFSGAVKRHCSAKCISAFSSSFSPSSSSTVSSCSTNSWTFSTKSSGFYELNLVNRSNQSADLETEKAIEGAIAHCKKSQQQHCLLQNNPVWIPSLARSRSKQKDAGFGDHGNPELCRI